MSPREVLLLLFCYSSRNQMTPNDILLGPQISERCFILSREALSCSRWITQVSTTGPCAESETSEHSALNGVSYQNGPLKTQESMKRRRWKDSKSQSRWMTPWRQYLPDATGLMLI